MNRTKKDAFKKKTTNSSLFFTITKPLLTLFLETVTDN